MANAIALRSLIIGTLVELVDSNTIFNWNAEKASSDPPAPPGKYVYSLNLCGSSSDGTEFSEAIKTQFASNILPVATDVSTL